MMIDGGSVDPEANELKSSFCDDWTFDRPVNETRTPLVRRMVLRCYIATDDTCIPEFRFSRRASNSKRS